MNSNKDNLNHIVVLTDKKNNTLSEIINSINRTHNFTNSVLQHKSLQDDIELIHIQLSAIETPSVMIANSYNSFTAINYAKIYPRKVKHLILLGCPPFDDEYVSPDEQINPSPSVTEIIELRKNNQLAAVIKQVKCPITFMHGKQDTNPYEGVQDVLNDNDVDFEFILYDQFGAKPWNEPQSAPSFFKMLHILIDEF